jgi:hypothetical protein
VFKGGTFGWRLGLDKIIRVESLECITGGIIKETKET